ncbi:MAG: HAD hydrolase family protein, partial [Polyangiales bacterium]
MSSYFKAIAIDFDGTLTLEGRPDEHVLGSLAQARDAGMALLLVTGRVVSDLLQVFPDAEQWFDMIVAENGAVIRRHG